MKCPECQREMSEGALFCNGCGAALTDMPLIDADPAEHGKTKFYWPRWSIYALAIISFCIVICIALISIRTPKTPAIHGSDYQSSNPSSVTSEIRAEYSKIFTDAAIPDRPASDEMKKYDYQAYAKETEEGYIEKWEFGYKNETLYALARTFYISRDYVAAYYKKDSVSTADINRFVNTFVGDPLPSQSFITVKRSVGASHGVIVLTAVKLDNAENYKAIFGNDKTNVSYLNNWLISNGFTTMYE